MRIRVCEWCRGVKSRYGIWPYPLCQKCEQDILRLAHELDDAGKAVTFASLAGAVPEKLIGTEIWRSQVRSTLVHHHGWTVHEAGARASWGKCPVSVDETHFHPPKTSEGKQTNPKF